MDTIKQNKNLRENDIVDSKEKLGKTEKWIILNQNELRLDCKWLRLG